MSGADEATVVTAAYLRDVLTRREEMTRFTDEEGHEHVVMRGVSPNGRLIVFDEVANRPPQCLGVLSTAEDAKPVESAQAIARDYEGRRPSVVGPDRVVSRTVTLEDVGGSEREEAVARGGGESDDRHEWPEPVGWASVALG